MPAYDYLVNLGITSANFDTELKRMLGELDNLEKERKIKLDVGEAITEIGKIQMEINNLKFPATIFDPAKAALQDLVNLANNLVTSLSNVSIPTGAGAPAVPAGGAGVGKVPGGGFGINVGSMKKEAADYARITKRAYHEQEGLFTAMGAKPSIDILKEWAEGVGGVGGLESLKGKFDDLKKKIEELNDLSLIKFRQELESLPKTSQEAKQLKMMYDALVEAHKKLGQAIRDSAKEQQRAIETYAKAENAVLVLTQTMSKSGTAALSEADYLRRLKATFGDVVKGAKSSAEALTKVRASLGTLTGDVATQKLGETISEVSSSMSQFKKESGYAADKLKEVDKLNKSLVQSELALASRQDRVLKNNKVQLEDKKRLVVEEHRGLKVLEREVDTATKLAHVTRTRYLIPGERKGEEPREVTRQKYQRFELDRRMLENRRSMFKIDRELLTKVIRFGIIYRGILSMWTGSVDAAKEVVRTMMEMDRIAGEIAKISPQMFMMGPEGAKRLADVMRVAIMYSKQFGSQLESTTESMVLFFQQGISLSEVLTRTKGALELATVTGLENADSVEILTAAYEIYGKSIEKPMDFTNALIAVEQLHAVTARDLAQGLLATGSTAKEMGLGFHELMGALTAIGVVTRQTGKEVGTALRFILPRFFTDEAASQLDKLGIELYGFTEEGIVEMRKMGNILFDTAMAWDTMSQAAKVSFATIVAGRRRANTFLALMSNFPEYLKATEDALRSEGVAMLSLSAVTERLEKKVVSLNTLFKEFAFEVGQAGVLEVMTKGFDKLSKILGVQIDRTIRWRGAVENMFASYAESAGVQLKNLPKLLKVHEQEILYGLKNTSNEAKALGTQTLTSLGKTIDQMLLYHKEMQGMTGESRKGVLDLAHSLGVLSDAWKQQGKDISAVSVIYDTINDKIKNLKKGTEDYLKASNFRDLITTFFDLGKAIDEAGVAQRDVTTYQVAGKYLGMEDAVNYLNTIGQELKENIDAGVLKDFNFEAELMAKNMTRIYGRGMGLGKYFAKKKDFLGGIEGVNNVLNGIQSVIDRTSKYATESNTATESTDAFSERVKQLYKNLREAMGRGDIKGTLGIQDAIRELEKLAQQDVLAKMKKDAVQSFDAVSVSLDTYKNKLLELGQTTMIGSKKVNNFDKTIKINAEDIKAFGKDMGYYLSILKETNKFDPYVLDIMTERFKNLTVDSEHYTATIHYLFDNILTPGWENQIVLVESLLPSLRDALGIFDGVKSAAVGVDKAIEANRQTVKKLADTTEEYNKEASIESKHLTLLKTEVSPFKQELMALDNKTLHLEETIQKLIESARLEGKSMGSLEARLEAVKEVTSDAEKIKEDYYSSSNKLGKEESNILLEISKKYTGLENTIRKMPPAMQKMAISVVSNLDRIKGRSDIPMQIVTMEISPEKLRELMNTTTDIAVATDEVATTSKKITDEYENMKTMQAEIIVREKDLNKFLEEKKAIILDINRITTAYEKSLDRLEQQSSMLENIESIRLGVLKDVGWRAVDIAKEEYEGKRNILLLERKRMMESLKVANIFGLKTQRIKTLIDENAKTLALNESLGQSNILVAQLSQSVEDYSRSVDSLTSYLDKNYSILSSIGYTESQIIDIRLQDAKVIQDLMGRYEGLNREKLRNLDITIDELKIDKQIAEVMEKYNKILQESEFRLKKQEFKLEIEGLKFERLGVSENLTEILDVERTKGELEEARNILSKTIDFTKTDIVNKKGLETAINKVLGKEKGVLSSIESITNFLVKQGGLTKEQAYTLSRQIINEKTIAQIRGEATTDTQIVYNTLLKTNRSQEEANKLASMFSFDPAIESLYSIEEIYGKILDTIRASNITEQEKGKAIESLDKLKANALAIERRNLVLSNRERERAVVILQDQMDILSRNFDLTKQRIEGESNLYLQLTQSEYEIGNTRREQEQQLSLIKYSRSEYAKQYPILDNIYQIQKGILDKHLDEIEAEIKKNGLKDASLEIRNTILDQLGEENKTYQDQIASLDNQLLTLQLQEQQIMANQRASEGWLRTQQAVNAAQAIATGMRAAAESAYQGRQEEAQLRRELELERERVTLQMARGKMPERTAKGYIASLRRIEVQLEQTRKKNRRDWITAGLEGAIPGFQKMVEDFKLKLIDEDQETKMRRLFIDNATMSKDILISGAEIAGNKLVQSATMSAQILSGGGAVMGPRMIGGKPLYGPPIPPSKMGFGDLLKMNDRIADTSLGIEKANNTMKNQLMYMGADIAKELAVATIGKGAPEAGMGADIGAMAGGIIGGMIPGAGILGVTLGSAAGATLGALIGEMFAEDVTEENTDAIEENTSELRRNTEQIKELSEQLIGAPPGFVMPQLKGMNVPGYGGGVVINVNAGGQDARQLALNLGRELGIASRRGGTVSPGAGGLIIIGGQGNTNRRAMK